eukprot:1171598-Amphidinium_carterae.1
MRDSSAFSLKNGSVSVGGQCVGKLEQKTASKTSHFVLFSRFQNLVTTTLFLALHGLAAGIDKSH